MKSLLSFTIILCSCIINIAIAQPGALDNTFGDGGKQIAFSLYEEHINAVALMPDGKIVIGGSVANELSGWDDLFLLRYLPNGNWDDTFGGGSFITLNPELYVDYLIYDIAILPDGNIIVAGEVYKDDYYRFSVVKILENGLPASSFGNDGFFEFSNPDVEGHCQARSVAAQADGKIIVGGIVSTNESYSEFGLIRLNSNGTLDDSFGVNGFVTTKMGWEAGIQDIAIQSDGKIIAVGNADNDGPHSDFAITRYLPNGSLDITFNDDGKQTLDFFSDYDGASSVVLLPDGKILVGGYCSNDVTSDNFALAKYLADGSFDGSFGFGGATIHVISNSDERIEQLALQSDGKILAGGTSNIDGSDPVMTVARFSSNGEIDPTFGIAGISNINFGMDCNNYGYDMQLQPDGKVVIAGEVDCGSTHDAAVARLLTGLESPTTDITYSEIITTYPNPVLEAFYLIPEYSRALQLGLYTVQGQLLASWKDYQDFEKPISVESLPSGVYFLKIYDKEGLVALKKVIKE